MDERIYIQWTVINWLTVFLMATVGFLLVGLIAQASHNIMGGKSPFAGSDQ